MNKYKYVVVEAKEDPNETIIEKQDISIRLTVNELESDRRRVDKIKAQIEGQMKIDEASLQNVITNHPFVVEATEEETKKAVALSLYNGIKNTIDEHKKKLEEIEALYKEHEEELQAIKEQTGIEINIPSPYVKQ